VLKWLVRLCKSAEEICIFPTDLCISLKEIHISSADLCISLAHLCISSREFGKWTRGTGRVVEGLEAIARQAQEAPSHLRHSEGSYTT